ncbi:CARDB domain-containing protein [Hymenobacter sp. B81]|uniref:CARDB domain-containing protein n=1 Tax=Hymenobacter sp. B81 TaxID=3344878 RepID=UPI0037DD5D57
MKNLYPGCWLNALRLTVAVLLTLVASTAAQAQTYLMPASGSTTLTTCSGALYDDGGANNFYSANANGVVTINPAVAGNKIRLQFTQFVVESGYDRLTVYDGNSLAAPQIGVFDSSNPPGVLFGTSSSGALTLQFTSDGIVQLDGFRADISCVTTVPQADLTVQAAAVQPTSVTAGSQVTVSSTVMNMGALASSSNLGYYLSTNQTLEPTDQLLGSSFGGSLATGGSSPRTSLVTVPAGTAVGTYYILFVADYQGQVSESNEQNNVAAAVFSVTSPSVDLTILQPNVSTTTPVAGTFLNLSCNILNQGNTVAASSSVGYYLSTNSTLDAGDQLLASSFGSSLGPGFPSSRFAGATLPASTTPGTYYLLFVADYQSQVAETNEQNNVASLVLTVVTPSVDLLVQAPSVNPTAVPAGALVNADYTYVNQGTTQASSSGVGFFLSTNQTLDASDVAMNQYPGPSLPAGQPQVRWASFTVPGGTAPGNYFVLFMADPQQLVAETNEQNNVVATPLTVLAPSVDLLVQQEQLGTSTATAGAIVPAYAYILNQGTTVAASSSMGYYLSTNSTLDAGDQLLTSVFGSSLGAGQSSYRGTSLQIPGGTASGNYFVLFVADHQNQVSETNEQNNVRSLPLTIAPASVDLLVQQPVINPTATAAGSLVNTTYTYLNQGTTAGATSGIGYYLSTNQTLDASDVAMDQYPGPSIPAGAVQARSAPFTVPAGTAPGNYFVLFMADPQQLVAETNELNNVTSTPITILPSGTDLVVQQEQLAASSASPGSALGASAYVFNQGNQAASSSALGYYLSTNQTLDSNDQLIGSAFGGFLPGGQSGFRGATLQIPAGTAPGNYFVLFVADFQGQVSELNETNNVRSLPLTIAPASVDLLLQFPSVNPTAVPAGAMVNTSYTYVNQGTTTASSSGIGFYLSTNQTLDASDVAMNQYSGSPLAAGASQQRGASFTVPLGTAPGSYYALFVADAQQLVAETNELNNVVAVPLTVLPPGIDLVVSQPTLSRFSASAGATIQGSVFLGNQGTSVAPPSMLGYYLSSDSQFSSNDVSLALTPASPLGPNSGQQYGSNLLIPAATTPGSYFVLFVADAQNTVSETNELNNVISQPLTVLAPFNGLIVPTAGTATVTSCGTTVYDNGGTDDYANGSNGTLTINPATAGAKVRLTFTQFNVESGFDYLRIYDGPTALAPMIGTYSSNSPGVITASALNSSGALTLVFTSDGVVTAPGFQATVSCFSPALPDLTLTQASATPTTVAAGGPLTVNLTVANQGPGDAASTPVSYYLSANTTLDASDRLIGNTNGGSLTTGQSQPRSNTLTVPTNVASGAYYLLCMADAGSTIVETNEQNNLATPISLTVVGAAPDLTLTSPTVAPNTVPAGNSVVTTCFYENIGPLDAAAHGIGYYLSTDNQLSSNDVLVGSSSLAAGLPSGAGSTRVVNVQIPANTVPGSYFLLYVADHLGQVAETNEQNNLAARPLTVTINTAVREQTAGFAISLYPNPTAYGKTFRVQFDGAGTASRAELTLLNSVGQVVSHRSAQLRTGAPVEFSTEGLARGVYTLRISGENLQAVRRVVID